jgi:DNA-binding CsgD family transcriptional regulator
VAIARLFGTLTARLARQKGELPAVTVDDPSWATVLDYGIAAVVETFASLIPEYRGRSAVQLLRSEGAPRLIGRIAACERDQLARHGSRAILSLRLSSLAIERGATCELASRPTGVLDAFFAPAQRRAARRQIERACERAGVPGVRLDFAAMWRTGNAKPIPVHHLRAVAALLESPPRRGFPALLLWLFLADCWTARANPFSVLYLSAVQFGYERLANGTDAYRQALTEALVVATRADLPLEGLEDLGSGAWPAVLTGDLLEWAASILVRFEEAMQTPGQLARFRIFEFVATLERAGDRGRRHERTIEEHLRRLDYRVVRLDAGDGVVASPNDGLQRLPDIHELRDQIAKAKLTPRQRQVLALRAHDLDFVAIGKELNINPSTARVLMLRTRRAIGAKQLPRRKSA